MFFTLSKLAALVIEPANFIILMLVFGLCSTLTSWRKTSRFIVVSAILLLLIGCFTPLSSLLLATLENRFRVPANFASPTGIVVLGGAIDEEISLARDEISLNGAASRLTAAVELARKYPNARLVFTGGPSDLMQTDHDEAEGVRRLWRRLGVPDEQMSFEAKSRNTYENAVFTRSLVHPNPSETWLLVTSAWHMPRSVGIFRRAGFAVTPYPVDYRTFGDQRDWRWPTSAIKSLDRLDTAIHEWVGLIAYRLTGRTDTLLP